MNHLKHATKKEHEALEAEMDLLREDFTLADYTALLERFQAFLEPWERRIEHLIEPEAPGFTASRRKAAWIASDLRDLGKSGRAEGLPERVRLPELTTAAEAFGSMYVLEGSTLGAKILMAHFAARLGVTAAWGGRYFSGYGNGTGAMWRGFGEILETRPARESESMTGAAISTYRALRGWLGNAAVPAGGVRMETGVHARD